MIANSNVAVHGGRAAQFRMVTRLGDGRGSALQTPPTGIPLPPQLTIAGVP